MRPVSISELLAAWERGLSQPPIERTLTLLAAACPETPPDALAKLSIGERDARLLLLREWTFGPHLVSLATCINCGKRLELDMDVADIHVDSERTSGESLSLSVGGYEVEFRLPNSLDLMALANSKEIEENGWRLLLERCLTRVRQDGAERSIGGLPLEVAQAVVGHMGRADPQAEIQLALSCPHCAQQWQATFDIASYLWSEINTWAVRTLRDVHRLASAYCWREADILAMSPQRRQAYLEILSE